MRQAFKRTGKNEPYHEQSNEQHGREEAELNHKPKAETTRNRSLNTNVVPAGFASQLILGDSENTFGTVSLAEITDQSIIESLSPFEIIKSSKNGIRKMLS